MGDVNVVANPGDRDAEVISPWRLGALAGASRIDAGRYRARAEI